MRFPAAVAVEFFGTRHFGRHIARRRAAFIALVVAQRPFAESVVRQRAEGRAQFARRAAPALAPQVHALAGFKDEATRLVDAQGAAPNAGLRGVVDTVDAVVPSAQRQQTRFTGDDLDLVCHLTRTHTQRQAAAVQLHADALIVQAQHFKFGGSAQAQHGGADAQFGTALRRGGNAVAASQRQVAFSVGPAALLVVEPRDAALHVGQAADAAWWVGLRQGGLPSQRGQHRESADQKGSGTRQAKSDHHLR